MPKDEQTWPLPETIFTNLPPNQPLECLVRLYVIKVRVAMQWKLKVSNLRINQKKQQQQQVTRHMLSLFAKGPAVK